MEVVFLKPSSSGSFSQKTGLFWWDWLEPIFSPLGATQGHHSLFGRGSESPSICKNERGAPFLFLH